MCKEDYVAKIKELLVDHKTYRKMKKNQKKKNNDLKSKWKKAVIYITYTAKELKTNKIPPQFFLKFLFKPNLESVR